MKIAYSEGKLDFLYRNSLFLKEYVVCKLLGNVWNGSVY